jgi:hypothetical protein
LMRPLFLGRKPAGGAERYAASISLRLRRLPLGT